jgi:hypothetical protein
MLKLWKTDTFVIFCCVSHLHFFITKSIDQQATIFHCCCYFSVETPKCIVLKRKSAKSWLSIFIYFYWIRNDSYFLSKDNRLNIRSHVLTFIHFEICEKTRFPVFLCCYVSYDRAQLLIKATTNISRKKIDRKCRIKKFCTSITISDVLVIFWEGNRVSEIF